MSGDTKEKHWADYLNLILTAVIAFTGLTGLFLVLGQLNAMKKQLDLMEFDQRPWISIVPEKSGDLIFGSNEVVLKGFFTLKNVGKSPATNVWARYNLLPKFSNAGDISSQFAVCENMRVVEKDTMKVSRTMFPNEIFEDEPTMTTELKILTSALEGAGKLPSDSITFYVIGCVEYQSGSGKHHRTPFAFELVRVTYPHTIKISDRTIPGSHFQFNGRNTQTYLNPE